MTKEGIELQLLARSVLIARPDAVTVTVHDGQYWCCCHDATRHSGIDLHLDVADARKFVAERTP